MNSGTALLPQNQVNTSEQGKSQYLDPVSLTQFYVNPQDLIYIQNPLTDLESSSFAIVHIKYPCCNLCSRFCGFTYNFDTYLSSEKGNKYLFRSVSKINCSTCCVSDIISRFGKCISYSKASYDQLNSSEGTQYVELDRNKNCACCGCCDVLMDVNILKDKKRCAGILKIEGSLKIGCCDCSCLKNCCSCDGSCLKNCCSCSGCFGICSNCFCDFYNYRYCCEILSPENVKKYVIFEKSCCLSCKVSKNCGLLFNINDSNNKVVGKIEGIGKCCRDEYTFKVTFPAYSTVEDKLCILNAIYAIDTFGIY